MTPEDLFFSRVESRTRNMARGSPAGRVAGWQGCSPSTTGRPGQQLGSGDPDTGKARVIGIARLQREFQNQSTLGLLLTDYNFAGNHEQVLSTDTRLRWGSHLVFTGQAVRSQASYIDGTHPQGAHFPR